MTVRVARFNRSTIVTMRCRDGRCLEKFNIYIFLKNNYIILYLLFSLNRKNTNLPTTRILYLSISIFSKYIMRYLAALGDTLLCMRYTLSYRISTHHKRYLHYECRIYIIFNYLVFLS